VNSELLSPGVDTGYLSDQEVVGRVLNGDTGVFEVLMRRYNPRLYRTIRAILGSDEDVEDAMQDAYIQAYKNLAQFEGRSSLATWLTRIAVNQALGRLRKRRRVTSFDSELELEMANQEDRTPNPEKRLLNNELGKALEAALNNLPPRYRTILVLREIEGLSTSEAAECLGMSPDAAKVSLHRARLRLKETLARDSGPAMQELFAFHAVRCDRVVRRVFEKILKDHVRPC
jgi:RNA polymerase sigma-70 factor (ECF subfamily)